MTGSGLVEPFRIGLAGASLTGNKGAAAMAAAVIEGLTRRLPAGTRFVLFSLYPRRDGECSTYPNLDIVPAPPLVTIATMPAAALVFALLRLVRLPAGIAPKACRPLREMLSCDIVLDLSGISFVKGRTANTAFNAACILSPLLAQVPCVKLSQAFGPLGGGLARAAARLLLPGLAAVFPRGPVSAAHLETAGIGHAGIAPDLAFTLPSPEAAGPPTGAPRVAVMPSEVMRRRCRALGIDYIGVMTGLCRAMAADHGAVIVLIAHSNLGPGIRSHNNDHQVCTGILDSMGGDAVVEPHLEEKGPEELRALIGGCTMAISSRFHGMVSALASGVPVAATAWNHKYGEVMDAFGMGGFVVSAPDLSSERLAGLAAELLANREGIASKIRSSLESVRRSAEAQLDFVRDHLTASEYPSGRRGRPIPARFLPPGCRPVVRIGFSTDERTAGSRASGGLATGLLASRIASGRSIGAVVASPRMVGGRIVPVTILATAPEEVLASAGSIYGWMPHLAAALGILRKADCGPVDVVMLPCQAAALRRAVLAEPVLAAKLGLVVCLWCGHATRTSLADDLIKRWAGGAKPSWFRYRSGRWRGVSTVGLEDGRTVEVSFRKGFGLLQNLHADCRRACLSCRDHLGSAADISFGDAWLARERYSRNKKTIALAMTGAGSAALDLLGSEGAAVLRPASETLVTAAQKRSLAWHDRAPTRAALAPLFGYGLAGERNISPAHLPAALMELALVRAFDSPLRGLLLAVPWWAWSLDLVGLKVLQSIPRVRR